MSDLYPRRPLRRNTKARVIPRIKHGSREGSGRHDALSRVLISVQRPREWKRHLWLRQGWGPGEKVANGSGRYSLMKHLRSCTMRQHHPSFMKDLLLLVRDVALRQKEMIEGRSSAAGHSAMKYAQSGLWRSYTVKARGAQYIQSVDRSFFPQVFQGYRSFLRVDRKYLLRLPRGVPAASQSINGCSASGRGVSSKHPNLSAGRSS